jgi:xanthine dehydrogenase YagR molybdenum-binding subunit
MTPWDRTTVVGKPLPRVDAYERVSGSAVYTVDVSLPDMLHLAILRCPHAHALVRKVDAEAARTLPGVRAVLTHADPEANVVLPYPSWIPSGPPMRLLDPHCRYAGEEVAAVAAETPGQAREALRAIAVEYEERPFVLDGAEALKPGAPAVHEGGNVLGAPQVIQRGDVAKGLSEADAVVEGTYETSCEIHATMEPLSSVARWDGDRLTVWESSQGVFDHQEALAAALGLPLSSVRVVCKYMGGGFGSKAELSKHTLIAVLLARKTGRPVRSVLTREESFRCAGNRPPHTMTLKVGATKDGGLRAIDLEGVGVVGAYADQATGGFLAAQLYACPNVRIRETEAFVNAGKSRAMWAFGFPQCA